jgi:hypothetical protein
VLYTPDRDTVTSRHPLRGVSRLSRSVTPVTCHAMSRMSRFVANETPTPKTRRFWPILEAAVHLGPATKRDMHLVAEPKRSVTLLPLARNTRMSRLVAIPQRHPLRCKNRTPPRPRRRAHVFGPAARLCGRYTRARARPACRRRPNGLGETSKAASAAWRAGDVTGKWNSNCGGGKRRVCPVGERVFRSARFAITASALLLRRRSGLERRCARFAKATG